MPDVRLFQFVRQRVRPRQPQHRNRLDGRLGRSGPHAHEHAMAADNLENATASSVAVEEDVKVSELNTELATKSTVLPRHNLQRPFFRQSLDRGSRGLPVQKRAMEVYKREGESAKKI